MKAGIERRNVFDVGLVDSGGFQQIGRKIRAIRVHVGYDDGAMIRKVLQLG